jgi:hypothetical protein
LNNQLKVDHYVYLMEDKFGVVRYVGEGRNKRLTDLSGRTSEFISIYNDGGKTYKIRENLTKDDAINYEAEYLDLHLGNPSSSINLINKIKRRVSRDLSYEAASNLFELDTLTGNLIRRSTGTCADRFVGVPAGYTNPKGYVIVSVKGLSYRAHRIVWVLYNKQNIPESSMVNHIDGNPSNNKPSNLEIVSAVVNCHKKVNYNLTKTGVLGVTLKTHRGEIDSLVCASYATPDDGNKYKYFSVKKYGRDEAIRLATVWRTSKLRQTYPDIYKD